MSNNVEIKKIILKIGKKEIPLSLEEAKELKRILADMFEKQDVIIVGQPYPAYPYLVYPRKYTYWTWNDTSSVGSYTLTCNSEGVKNV